MAGLKRTLKKEGATDGGVWGSVAHSLFVCGDSLNPPFGLVPFGACYPPTRTKKGGEF
ncbi:Uncharacterised protein [Actinobaculum suis]|uniref:Uncharacterized protein n=1 Tax=Actinobaculum suis TaxID=1657 RepID=A0A7Z9C978_9ACTO|nr:Uncharacterised protein [Actinobaculum suis]